MIKVLLLSTMDCSTEDVSKAVLGIGKKGYNYVITSYHHYVVFSNRLISTPTPKQLYEMTKIAYPEATFTLGNSEVTVDKLHVYDFIEQGV
jgi:hypothetical protein